MRSLRIKGVVAFADRMRRELAAPISESRKVELDGERIKVVRQVDRILAEHDSKVGHLPAPTRQAYQFLIEVDVTTAATAIVPGSAATTPRRHYVRLPGMKSYWDHVIARLSLSGSTAIRDDIFGSIQTASSETQQQLATAGLTLSDLTDQSRKIHGWFTFMTRREAFDAYVAGIKRARRPFEHALRHAAGFHPEAQIEFRPIRGLYKIRGITNHTRVMLPMPMITFSPEDFSMLAESALLKGNRQPVMEATTRDGYAELQTEIDVLCGQVSEEAGVCRDLGESFDRVNLTYFENGMARPRLVWSRTFTGRKFGHYEFIGDTLMVSCSLDRPDVPVFVLDFVMYHEMLHKKLGLEWRNGRGTAHTPEFRRQERRFDRYEKADSFLSRLASSVTT